MASEYFSPSVIVRVLMANSKLKSYREDIHILRDNYMTNIQFRTITMELLYKGHIRRLEVVLYIKIVLSFKKKW